MEQARNVTIAEILRYPVKGLAPDRLTAADLRPDAPLPGDRRFAIAHGSAPLDPANPVWLKKAFFLQLMSNPRLAALDVSWDEAAGELTLLRGGRPVTRGVVFEQTGRTVIEQFFAAFMKAELRGAPHLVDLGDRSFSDVEPEWISIIGLASIGDVERVVGRPVDPVRFRPNVLLRGTDAWEEFGWVGRTIRLGGALLRVEERIGRCDATHVDPRTGQKDMTITRDLIRGFGHDCCGVYARVMEPGRITVGDPAGPVEAGGPSTVAVSDPAPA